MARRAGEARRLRRGEEGGEKGQRTWPQPPSFPSPLPGCPRLHRTPWLPGPPHPCAQPLQKQPLPALRVRLWRPPRALRMLLPQLAPPPLAPLPLCPLKLLPAAMTAPRAAGRGVRVRERAGRWSGRDGGGDRAAGWGNEGGPRGPARRGLRARARSRTAREDGRARRAGSSRCILRPARKDLSFQEPTLPPPSTPRSVKVLWRVPRRRFLRSFRC